MQLGLAALNVVLTCLSLRSDLGDCVGQVQASYETYCQLSSSVYSVSFSSPQNPNRTQSSSGSHCSATWLRSSLPFKKRSNVPSSLMTRSRAVFVVVVWFESFRVRLTRHLERIMPLRTLLRRKSPLTEEVPVKRDRYVWSAKTKVQQRDERKNLANSLVGILANAQDGQGEEE